MPRHRLFLAAGGLLLTVAVFGLGRLAAQDGVFSQMYGSGCHAYHAGDLTTAHEYFTIAIDGGISDPRPYYYRGLTYLKLGRPDEAEADFAAGAELEAGDASGFYNVSKSIERVQGQARMKLERHRARARVAAAQNLEQLRRERYQQLRATEAEVLEPSEPAPDVGTRRVQPAPPPANNDAIGPNPFEPMEPTAPVDPSEPAPVEPADPAATPADPAVPAVPADEDPFGSDEPADEPDDEATDSDPFGESDEEMPADEADATEAEEPAADAGATEEDPFGADSDAAAPEDDAAPEEDSAEGAATEEDPLGTDEDADAATDEDAPAEEAADPFGE